MGKTKKIISIIVTILSVIALTTIKTEAATGTISISSTKSQVVVGNSVTFTVTVKSSINMAALQYNISYDSSLLSLTSGDSSGAPVFGNNVKTKTYTFKFKAKKAGTATFKFNAVGAAMDKDEEITFTTKSKSVKIITQAQLEASYSKNNNLSSLSVEGYSLSPKFSSSITSYTVNLPANTESIKITGKKADSNASVNGLGTKTVVDGINTIKITVTAENGSTKTYTINAVVEELNPIYVTINEKEYSVIRKAKLLSSPNSDFLEGSTKINEEEVPTLYNEKANITLIGLKDEEGNIELYIYNQTNNTYTKYNQYTFQELILYIEDKEIENFIEKKEIKIDEKLINVYTIENDSYYYFYAINLTTGKESIYRYDIEENTVQRYVKEETTLNNSVEKNKEKENEQLYKYIIIGLLGFIFLTYIIILFNLIFGKKEKNKRINQNNDINKEINSNKKTENENSPTEEKELLQQPEEQNKLKEKNKKKENKISEKEKNKLQKDTEEEINRIKENNSANNTIDDLLDNEQNIDNKSNKKNKKKKNKD